jgi:hypothetical protein
VGSAAALGVLGGGGIAAASTRSLRRPVSAPGVKGRIGSTVAPILYEGTNTRIGAASIFDGYVTSAVGATVIQKYYFNESQWLPKALLPSVTQLPAQYPDFKWIMCFRPSLDLTSADQNNLKRSCNLLIDAGIDFDVVLWQEPNGPNSTVFPTAADYQQYYYFYAPYVPSSIDIIYISCSAATLEDQASYFPSQGMVGKVYYDFYGNVFRTAHTRGNHHPLAVLGQIADENGLPFGLGEWGFGAAPTDGLTWDTKPSAGDFVNYIINVFTNRLDAGQTNGDVVYFDGRSPLDLQNLITGTTDWKVPLYQRVYDRLASTDGAGINGRLVNG